MQRNVVLLAAVLACASCSRKDRDAASLDVMVVPPPPGAMFRAHPADAAAAPAADAAAAPAIMPAEAAEGSAAGDTPALRIAAGPPMLAYSYSYGLAVPHRQVDPLRRRHEQACVKAGDRVCQVVTSSVTDRGDGGVTASLQLRAAPAWLATFRAGLEGEAKGAGGRIETSEVTSEDLSREIVDTEAQLRAKQTLRDRLQALLANRPGRLADLLAVERELARVQAELDSAQSQLAVMRARVAMSEIAIDYGSNDVVGRAVRSPLSQSASGFLGVMAVSLAGMIDLVAVAAPWVLVLGGLAWLFRKRLRKLRWPSPERAQV